ncbi:hypothetical protein HAX54_044268, partial [Datura stramonium]|nr:hypothetical protein [Datura stramonium]
DSCRKLQQIQKVVINVGPNPELGSKLPDPPVNKELVHKAWKNDTSVRKNGHKRIVNVADPSIKTANSFQALDTLGDFNSLLHSEDRIGGNEGASNRVFSKIAWAFVNRRMEMRMLGCKANFLNE